MERLHGGFELGVGLAFVFFAAIAAGADLVAMIRIAPLLVVLVVILLGIHLGSPLYFEAAAEILTIIAIGHWLEARASRKAGAAIEGLVQLELVDPPDIASRCRLLV